MNIIVKDVKGAESAVMVIESRPYIGEEKNPILLYKNMVNEVRVDIKRVVWEGDK